MFGAGTNFVTMMRERAAARTPSRVVNDQHGRPSYVRDVARVVVALAARPDVTGVLHVANDGEGTWYDVARVLYQAAGCEPLLTPVGAAEFGARAARPAYSVLSLARLASLGVRPRSWRAALNEFLSGA
jgi:dTDP-4-dehydrorhamnose reductase